MGPQISRRDHRKTCGSQPACRGGRPSRADRLAGNLAAGHSDHDAQLRETVSGLAKSSGTALIIGNSARQSPDRPQNKIPNNTTTVSPSYPLPGEVPGIQQDPPSSIRGVSAVSGVFPGLSRFAAGAGNFLPGKEYKVFPGRGGPFAVTICWRTFSPNSSGHS